MLIAALGSSPRESQWGCEITANTINRGKNKQQETTMAIPQRGEIDAVIDGETRTLCLTLGALAELEQRLQTGDLVGLAERFAGGRVSARDLTAIIGAGLRGGGNAISDDDLARLTIEGGLKGAAQIAVRLLKATFGEAA
jgi:hypothetical protein